MRPANFQETNPQHSDEWLFKVGDLVLGPVTGGQLVEKLYSGDASAATLVTPLGQDAWRTLKDVDGFKLHLAKAEAKLRVEATARQKSAKASRSRNARMAMLGALTVCIAIPAALGARYLAVHNPWKTAEELGPDITVEAPRITLAHRGSQEELAYYPVGTDVHSVKHAGSGAPATSARSTAIPGKRTEADGLELASLDQGSIKGIVATHQKTLYPCLVAASKRSPEMAAKVPIEFVVGNDGHVAKLWVDSPSLREGPLADCLLHELQKWPFKPYEGERATVALSFQIGRRT